MDKASNRKISEGIAIQAQFQGVARDSQTNRSRRRWSTSKRRLNHMFSIAAFRYRNVLASVDGGPVESIESGTLPVCGRPMVQANARLSRGLARTASPTLYGDADGTGTHRVASVARHMAVSAALERWAFHSTVNSGHAADFGFDIDPSSNGMSAFPGLVGRNARRSAMLAAVERYSLSAWWEGRDAGACSIRIGREFRQWRLMDRSAALP